MGDNQEFCLRWGSYQQQLSEALRNLLDKELLVDVTLACDGRSLRAHRAVLSACSNYFQDLFQQTEHSHPIIILKDVKFEELEALVHFMYHGEVTLNNSFLPGFLKTAETLQIRGLTSPNQESSSPEPKEDQLRAQEASGHDDDTDSIHFDMSSNTDMSNSQTQNIPPQKRIKTEPQQKNEISSHCAKESFDARVSSPFSQSANSKGSLRYSEFRTSSPESFTPPDQDFVQKAMTSLDSLGHAAASSHFLNQGAGSSRPFRQRVLWNHKQLLQLEAWYHEDRYPTGQTMRHYADTLAAISPSNASPSRQNVDYWFQNRRRKDSHPEVMQQREKKKLAKALWGQILDQKIG